MRLLLAVLLLSGFAFAQPCYTELRGELTDEQLAQSATGLDAARLLKRAVDFLEPVLPQLVNTPDTFPLAYGDEGFAEAQYLAQRGVLPPTWQAGELSLGTWQEMVSEVAAWYDLDPFTVAPELSYGALLETLSNLIGSVRPLLRPVALIATDPANRDAVAFWAIIRNNSVFPRLIVVRPPAEGVALDGGLRGALPLLGSCALELENFIYAPSDTAQRLFMTNTERSRMYVASTAPARDDGFTTVPSGEETGYLTFRAEDLSPYEMFAAVFEGPSVGPATLMRLLPQVRTNMNPREVLQFVLPGSR